MLKTPCKRCGYENFVSNLKCSRCATPLADIVIEEPKASTAQTVTGPNRPLIFGLAGSAILFIGVFTPIASVPILGHVNYFQNGTGDGVLILALSVVSVVLILANRYKGLLITGSLSILMLLFTLVSFQWRISSAKGAMRTELANNPLAGIGEAFIGGIQFQWGWALLFIGAVSLVVAGLFADRGRPIDDIGIFKSIELGLADNRVLGSVIVSILLLSVCGVLANSLISQGYSPKLPKGLAKWLPSSKAYDVRSMEDALEVTFVDSTKRLEDFGEVLVCRFNLRNTSNKRIRGFHGHATFVDALGREIKKEKIFYDGSTLSVGDHRTWSWTLKGSRKVSIDPNGLTIEFEPESVFFDDGTTLGTPK